MILSYERIEILNFIKSCRSIKSCKNSHDSLDLILDENDKFAKLIDLCESKYENKLACNCTSFSFYLRINRASTLRLWLQNFLELFHFSFQTLAAFEHSASLTARKLTVLFNNSELLTPQIFPKKYGETFRYTLLQIEFIRSS
jgi:hypothetical protein